MIRFFIIAICTCISCAEAVEVKVPKEWAYVKIPEKMPSSIRSLIKVTSPNKNAEVSISEMDIVMSLDEAAESYIRGASKGGYRHSATSSINMKGFNGMHIQGSFPIDKEGSTVPVEAYILLTGDSMLSIGVTGHEASKVIHAAVDWIDFGQFKPSPAEENGRSLSERSFGEYIGILAVIGALCYAIYHASLRRATRSSKG